MFFRNVFSSVFVSKINNLLTENRVIVPNVMISKENLRAKKEDHSEIKKILAHIIFGLRLIKSISK